MATRSAGERIFTLGRLIHNEDYNRRLQAGGVAVIGVEDLPRLSSEATPDSPVKVFVRAHGMTRETEAFIPGRRRFIGRCLPMPGRMNS